MWPWRTAACRQTLYLNDGLGCFREARISRQISQPDQNSHVAAFDANGDAAPDLAVGAALFLNQDNRAAFVDLAFAGFETGNAGDLSGVSGYENATVFDANGDGGQDVLMSEYYGSTGLYLHDGYGSYQLTEADELDDLSILSAAAFDADGDGDLDVASIVARTISSSTMVQECSRVVHSTTSLPQAPIRIWLPSMRTSTGMSIWQALRAHRITPAPSFSTMEPWSH